MRVPRIFSYIVVGRPQIYAGLLLLIFIGQCVYLMGRLPFSSIEQDHIWAGRQELEYGAVPRTFEYSPLPNVMAAAPMRIDAHRVPAKNPTPENVQREVKRMRWLLRAPFLLIGILLGMSLWYVSRRLYGDAGGYVALSLYCFSPAMVLRAATIRESGPSAWGVFGMVFTAIAISHNLYAPWRKWRYRTLLLSISIALGVASHPAAMMMVPVALGLMWYLAPGRRWASLGVILFSSLVAAFMVYAAYGLQPNALFNGIDLRVWMKYTPQAAQQAFFANSKTLLLRFNPAVMVLLVISLITYFIWKRTRYFGNTAPLLIWAGLMYWAMVSPMVMIASVWALPFAFVFIGGISADLLETRRRPWILGALALLLMENIYFCWTILRQAK